MFKRFKNSTALAALIGLAAASEAIAQAPLRIGQIDIGVTAALAPTDHAQNTQISSNFSLRLLVTATDPLENPSNIITRFGELSTGVDTVPDIHTYLKLPRNPGGGRKPVMIMAAAFSFRGTRTAATSPISPA